MSFSAKVIATGELFLASTDMGPDKKRFRDAHSPLNKAIYYMGNLLPGSLVGNSFYVEYSGAETAVYHGSELEEVDGDIRLMPIQKTPEAG
jgi:hypothetical protein